MAHLIAVFSPNADTARRHLTSCIGVTRRLYGQDICAVKHFPGCSVATFPRRAFADESGQLHVFDRHNAWSIGVGTWVYSKCSGDTTAEEGLAAAVTAPTRLLAEILKIDGGFCFLTGSLHCQQVHLVTDPIGQLHAYRFELDNLTVISTSALVLAHLAGARLDPIAVREFLSTGSVFEGRSLFEKVHKIEPAAIHTFSNGRPAGRSHYWSLNDYVDAGRDAKSSLTLFAESVTDGVAGLLRRFERPAIDLTGGFDSRIILACAMKAVSRDDFNTIVTGDALDPDVVAAGGIARHFNLRHQRLDSRPASTAEWWRLAQRSLPLVDGEYDLLEYAAVLNVHQQLAEQLGVSINGSGGELIRGYWWELLFPRTGNRGSFESIKLARARFATDRWAEKLLSEPGADSLDVHFAHVIERANAPLLNARNTACMDNIYLTLRMQRWQGRIASATNRIWPCVSPLLFRRSMEAAVAAPIALRRNGRMARRLLEYLNSRLARLPMAGGYPALPVTATTLHLFYPLAQEYAGRVTQRLFQRRRKGVETGDPRLQHLANLDEVAPLIDIKSMLTAELYNQTELARVLELAKYGRLPAKHLGRMLTLEVVRRGFDGIRSGGVSSESVERSSL